MITGELRSQVDRLWDAFWAGGIANPLEVIEQITYLLFIKRLDDLHTAREKKATRLNRPIENPVFGPDQQTLRWSRFKHEAPAEMARVVSDQVFPFIRALQSGRADSTYAHHMKDARFTIPTAGLLAKVVDMIDHIPMEERDTKGDLYEYMLGKIASAGQNGQFRTPRHIIRMMVEMVAPQPRDIVCDPACGTAGFLVAVSEQLRDRHSDLFTHDALRRHFNEQMFNGFDFDATMLRIGSMKVIVPDGVLFGSSNAHKMLRQSLVEEQKLDAVISMPSGVFKPYAGVSTAVLFFTKTNSGGTEEVWFYDIEADGFSLDDKRIELDHAKHENDNIPDIVARWQNRAAEQDRPRTAQSFTVLKADIAANGYDLSINRYKEVTYQQEKLDSPQVILAELKDLERDIQKEMAELEAMLG